MSVYLFWLAADSSKWPLRTFHNTSKSVKFKHHSCKCCWLAVFEGGAVKLKKPWALQHSLHVDKDKCLWSSPLPAPKTDLKMRVRSDVAALFHSGPSFSWDRSFHNFIMTWARLSWVEMERKKSMRMQRRLLVAILKTLSLRLVKIQPRFLSWVRVIAANTQSGGPAPVIPFIKLYVPLSGIFGLLKRWINVTSQLRVYL